MTDLYVMDAKITSNGEVEVELLALHTLSDHNAPQDVEFVVSLKRLGTKVKEWGYWSLTNAIETYDTILVTLSCFKERKK